MGDEEIFPTMESKKEFAQEISDLVNSAWKVWQDSVVINDVDVEGAKGMLRTGGFGKPVLTVSSMLKSFDREGRSQDYIACVKAVLGAIENGMRMWQRGYSHMDIPFPQGVSCVYTLPPCNNVPISVRSGQSTGDSAMEEGELYSYMLYRAPRQEEGILVVFSATAKAVAECFNAWEKSCSLIDILAKGGIAPAPAPMGMGPGAVRGAKGAGGKLVGNYFDTERMYQLMVAEFLES